MADVKRIDDKDGVSKFEVTCQSNNVIGIEAMVRAYVEDPVAYPPDKEMNVIFSTGICSDGVPLLSFMIPFVAWDKVLSIGNTSDFDLTRIGLKLRVIISGCKDYQTAMNMVYLAAQMQGIKIEKTSADLSFDTPKE